MNVDAATLQRRCATRKPRGLPRLAALCTPVLAAMALAGCAALQIDVDVYKGPLINNEELQRDQVLSMALSAKPLLLEMRNRLLDAVDEGWQRHAGLGDDTVMRRSSLRQADLDRLADALQLDDKQRTALRNARQLNEILTFYEDLGDPWLQASAAYIEQLQHSQDDLLGKLAQRWNSAGVAGVAERKAILESPQYRALVDLQASIWNELSTLFLQVVAPRASDDIRAASKQGADPDARADVQALLDEIAQRLVERTEPRLVACVLHADAQRQAPVGAARLDVLRHHAQLAHPTALSHAQPQPWSGLRYEQARKALRYALHRAPEESVMALKDIDSALRTGHPCAQAVAGSNGPSGQLAPLRAAAPALAGTGLARRPWLGAAAAADAGEDDMSQAQSLGELMARVHAVDANGFQHGRVRHGIQSLANRYSELRDVANRLPPDDPRGRPQREKAQVESRRLEHMLVDMAGRMQFLATNLWLLQDKPPGRRDFFPIPLPFSSLFPKEDIERYKTMLEAVSNNLLVYSDDLRNRAQFEAQQLRRGPYDRAAASAAFNVSSAGAFALIEQALESAQRSTAAQDAHAEVATLADSIVQLKKDTLASATLARQTQERADTITMLACTMGVRKPLKDQPGACTGDVKEQDSDARRLKAVLNGGEAQVSFDGLLAAVGGWITAQKSVYTGDALQSLPRARRLDGAAKGLASFKTTGSTTAGKRKEQVAQLYQLVADARDSAWRPGFAQSESACNRSLPCLEQKLKSAQDRLAATGSLLSSAEAAAVLQQVRAVKDAVLKDVAAQLSKVDYDSVRRSLNKHLQQAHEGTLEAGKDKTPLAMALKFLTQLPQPTAVQLATLPADSSTLDVLDTVIAQLRFQAIEATRLAGPDSDTAKNADAALKRALKDREQQIFIRPSSTYLRSVYTATTLQDDPGSRDRNMLLDRWNTLIQGLFTSNDKVSRTRLDLDKAFWQNINTVRVSASGASNFVLAKDDVGNWYVKAVGADPKAMINAAKGLALYNLGGRFDANLLRIDELQQKIDAARSDAEAQPYRAQLQPLLGGNNGAGVGARSETLGLFVKNYDDQAAAHLKDLAAQLAAGQYQADIRTRWALSLVGHTDVRALDGLFNDAEVALQVSEARMAADVSRKGSDAASAVIKALQSMQRLRLALKALVLKHAPLTATQLTQADGKADELLKSQSLLDPLDKKVTDSNDNLLLLALRAKKAKDDGETDKAGAAQLELDTARARDAELRVQLKVARDDVAAKKTALSAAQDALAQARSRQARAAADVDAVLKAAVDQAVAKRLRSVEETETAVKVIGRTGA